MTPLADEELSRLRLAMDEWAAADRRLRYARVVADLTRNAHDVNPTREAARAMTQAMCLARDAGQDQEAAAQRLCDVVGEARRGRL